MPRRGRRTPRRPRRSVCSASSRRPWRLWTTVSAETASESRESEEWGLGEASVIGGDCSTNFGSRIADRGSIRMDLGTDPATDWALSRQAFSGEPAVPALPKLPLIPILPRSLGGGSSCRSGDARARPERFGTSRVLLSWRRFVRQALPSSLAGMSRAPKDPLRFQNRRST
jgi:hypothetical protein